MNRMSGVVAAAAVTITGLLGCAPGDRNVYRADNFSANQIQGKKVLLVTDACVKRFTKDVKPYVCLSDSRRSSAKLAMGLSAYLVSQGMPRPVLGPRTVGGFVAEAKDQPVSNYPAGQAAPCRPPFWLSEEWGSLEGLGVQAPAEMAKALAAAAHAVYKRDPKKVSELAGNDAFREAVKLLGQRSGCDYVLLATSEGWISSYEIRLKTAMPQAFITAAATLGTVSAAAFPVTYVTTHVALVDARTGSLLWANQYSNGGDDNRLAVQLYDGEGWDLRYEDAGRFDKALVEKISDPQLQAWSQKPWNGPWLQWTKDLLYHLAPAPQQ